MDELAPGWFAHRFEVRDPAELEDPELANLICESYREIGAQGRLRGRRARATRTAIIPRRPMPGGQAAAGRTPRP